MFKYTLAIMLAFVVTVNCGLAFAEQNELAPEQVKSIAVRSVQEKGIAIEEVSIIYDEGNKLWAERIGSVTAADTDPNYGVLKKGFLRNYRTVYFDFKEPVKDIWVFIDKDTGEVLEVYREP